MTPRASKLELLTLGELTNKTRPICYGVLKPGLFVRDGIPLVRVTDISENVLDTSNLYRISEKIDGEFSRSRLRGGELLISIQGTIGRIAQCPMELAGANISRTIAVIDPDERVDRRYLYWFLRRTGERNEFRTVGSTRLSLNIASLRQTRVPVPPPDEQKRIATILDAAEALREKRREAISVRKNLEWAMFLHMFGEPLLNTKQWPLSTLEDACETINDCPHSTPAWATEGVVCLRTSNLTAGGWNWSDTRYVSEAEFLDRSQRGFLEEGDVVLSREGTVGIAALVPPQLRMCMGQRLVQLRPLAGTVTSTYLLGYLLYALAPNRISQLMVGSTSQHLNVKELRALRLPLPPTELQRAYESRIDAAHGQLEVNQLEARDWVDRLCLSFQHRAFRGEL